MKILFLITRGNVIGGAQTIVRELARAFDARGDKVLVVTGTSGIFNTLLEREGIQTIACNTLQNPIAPWKDGQALAFLVAAIRQYQPDLVSAHSSKAGILGRFACKITNTPCIFTAHGWAFAQGVPEPKRTLYQILERLAEPRADKIICVSECDRAAGIEVGMNPDKLVAIHNGIADLSAEFKVNLKARDRVRIVMVARFDRQKDHLTLLKAFRHLSRADLDLVGDGPNLEAVQKVAHEFGIAERIKFWGYCDRIAEILAQADIFALISHWEGLPCTILEAMRAGLPVVASNVGGVSEAVLEGITGYCVPPGEVDPLRNRLEKLVGDPHLRSEMGRQGRARYQSEFTVEQMFEKTFQVYAEVAKI